MMQGYTPCAKVRHSEPKAGNPMTSINGRNLFLYKVLMQFLESS